MMTQPIAAEAPAIFYFVYRYTKRKKKEGKKKKNPNTLRNKHSQVMVTIPSLTE